MIWFLERFLQRMTVCPYKENAYTTITKKWKYWYSVYIDFNKKRDLLRQKEEKENKERYLNQLKQLDFDKPIFLSTKGVSNKSWKTVNEYTLIWVTDVQDLLKRIQLVTSETSWLKIPVSIF